MRVDALDDAVRGRERHPGMQRQTQEARTRPVGHLERAVGAGIAKARRRRVQRNVVERGPDVVLLELPNEIVPCLLVPHEEIVEMAVMGAMRWREGPAREPCA